MPDPAVEEKPPQPVVVDAVAAPVVAAAEAKPEVKPEPKPEVAPVPKKDWKDDRIAELTAKLNAEKSKKAADPTPLTPPSGESPEAIQARIESEANRLAGEIAANNDWNARCNAVNEQGKKEFPDFPDRLSAVQSVANLSDPAEFAQFNAVIAAALETGQAHKLIHQLGETPGEVKKLMAMPPLKMAMEIAARAAKIGAPAAAPEPSDAPKPITLVGSRGNHYDGLDVRTPNGTKLPIGEWMKQREKQAADAGIQ